VPAGLSLRIAWEDVFVGQACSERRVRFAQGTSINKGFDLSRSSRILSVKPGFIPAITLGGAMGSVKKQVGEDVIWEGDQNVNEKKRVPGPFLADPR